MPTAARLSPAQSTTLAAFARYADEHGYGVATVLPGRSHGRTVAVLRARGFLAGVEGQGCFITAAGRVALGWAINTRVLEQRTYRVVGHMAWFACPVCLAEHGASVESCPLSTQAFVCTRCATPFRVVTQVEQDAQRAAQLFPRSELRARHIGGPLDGQALPVIPRHWEARPTPGGCYALVKVDEGEIAYRWNPSPVEARPDA